MNKIKVLFLCRKNTARSQMAEAFLRKNASDRFEVYSAGLEPSEIHPVERTMKLFLYSLFTDRFILIMSHSEG